MALPAWERYVLFRQMLSLALTRLWLHRCGLRATIKQLGAIRQQRQQAGLPAGLQPLSYAQRCATLTAMAAQNGPVRANCLPQALALHDLLKRRGIASELRIAVLPGSTPLEAHAWVEMDAVPLGGNPPEGYRLIEQLDCNALGQADNRGFSTRLQD